MTYIALHRYIQPRKTNLQGSHADFTTLRDKALAGLKLKMGSDPIPENYRERLKRELDMVANMRLEKYFLLVSDIVSDLHNMGILVGVWHGNSTGSFMCYCLGITQIHSLSHELFFEGFLTPVTRFMPPICLDFSHIHRKEVFEYLRSKYGNENISSVCSDIRDRKTPMSPSTTIPSCGVYFLNMTGARSLSTKDEKCSPLHNDASVLDEGGYIGIGLNGLEILSVIEKIQAQIKIQENLNVDVNKVPCDDAKAYAPILPWDNRIQSLIQLLILADLQLPAHAEDAEQAILGSMLLEPEAIKTAHEMLDATNFYHRANRIIFSSIGELFNHQGAVNLATLRGILKSSGRLFEVGGEIYLAELIGKAATAGDVQHYAEIVRQKARLRDLMSSATAIAENNYETKKELAKLMNHAEEKLFAIAQKSALVDFVSADGIAEDFTYNLEREMKIRNVITGVPTGFHRFDEMTGGLQRTDLIILASRPSLGKTTMALNIAYNAAVEKKYLRQYSPWK